MWTNKIIVRYDDRCCNFLEQNNPSNATDISKCCKLSRLIVCKSWILCKWFEHKWIVAQNFTQKLKTSKWVSSETGVRAVYGVGLQPFDCWDCRFEYRWGHGYSSLVFVCCVGSGLCDELITRSEEFYLVRVSKCVWPRNLKRGGLGASWAVAPQEEKNKICEC